MLLIPKMHISLNMTSSEMELLQNCCQPGSHPGGVATACRYHHCFAAVSIEIMCNAGEVHSECNCYFNFKHLQQEASCSASQ